MGTAAESPMGLDQFLAWERTQATRYEFDGTRPVAMTGGSLAHSEIATAVVEALRRRLAGGPCRAYRGDVKVIARGRVRYPDAVVTCSAVDPRADIVPDPVVVFEVTSPSTASVDSIVKNEEYAATPSIRHYVMLAQGRPTAIVYSRDEAGWTGRVHAGRDAVIPLPALGVDLGLAELYAGVPADDEE